VFIRFVVHTLDPDSGRRQGILQALRELRDDGLLRADELDTCNEVFDWLYLHLERPHTFTRSRKRHARPVALSWFKPSATAHIAHMRTLMAVLEAHGIPVEVLREQRPGYIVYEDEHQIVAEPFQETAT
jgi:hypothetical protein